MKDNSSDKPLNRPFLDESLEKEEKNRKGQKSPLVYISSVFIILLIIIFLIPVSSIKWIPQPKNIPSVEEVLKNAPEQPEQDDILRLENLQDASKLKITPFLKHVGSEIGSSCYSVSDNCYAKAIYLFVRNGINYVRDPKKEYIEGPKAVLLSKSADCDGQAVLLYALLKSVGVNTRIAVTQNHAFVQAELPTRIYLYKSVRRWVNLDPTCKECRFGSVPSEDIQNIAGYIK